MTLDLQHSLTDLARSVADEALTERLTVQVGPMVSRIRRRRAARVATAGTLGIGAVAAAAVAAVALVDPGGHPAPGPAGQTVATAPVAHDGAPLACGDVLPDDLVGDPTVAVAGETTANVAADGELLTTLRWWAAGWQTVSYTQAHVDLAVARDDVVVAVAEVEPQVPAGGVELGRTETGTPGQVAAAVAPEPCDGEALAPGSYRVVATLTLTAADGTVRTATAGPWPLTLSPAGAGAPSAAEAAVQAILDASADLQAAPGTCGAPVPSLTGDELLALELDLGSGSGMRHASGASVDAVALLTATGGRTVHARLAESGPTVVLARDGVVVGGTLPDGGHAASLSFTDDPRPFFTAGVADICALPGEATPRTGLPSGIYQAYAVVPVTIERVIEADGTATETAQTVVVHSLPVDVIVQAGR